MTIRKLNNICSVTCESKGVFWREACNNIAAYEILFEGVASQQGTGVYICKDCLEKLREEIKNILEERAEENQAMTKKHCTSNTE